MNCIIIKSDSLNFKLPVLIFINICYALRYKIVHSYAKDTKIYIVEWNIKHFLHNSS
jgi:hypothetical protein